MKLRNYIRTIAAFMILLIISLPFIFAEEYSRTYDKNGNLVYDSQTDIYREYNDLNQLIRTRQNNLTGTILQEYVWDPLKERIFVKDEFYSNGSLKSSTYYFDDDYIVLQNSSGTYNRTNIYQDGTLIGYEDFDGKKRYVLTDHKGSAHLILNESGDVIEENLFSPFAEPLAGVKENKFSYEAKEFDSLTKDYNFNFRMLSSQGPPILNQPDTLIKNVYDPQSLNRYSFERNNPYRYVDKNGHQVESLALLGWVGGILLILSVLAYTALYASHGIGHDVEQTNYESKVLQEIAANKANQVQYPIQNEEPHKDDSMQPKSTEGTYVPHVAKEEKQRVCELANIDCGQDSRLKIKIDPTIEQDKSTTKKPEEKKEEKQLSSTGSGGRSSPGGAAVGSHDCSWWSDCIVKSIK